MQPLEVILFEDNRHLRESLEMVINSDPALHCAASFANGSDAVTKMKKHNPDIVLMDIAMPRVDGIDATRQIKSVFPDAQILIQTVFSDDDYIFRAICAGASGYILKSTTPEGYIAALKDIGNGGSPMTPGIARRIVDLFRNAMPQTAANSKPLLSFREKEVLHALVDGKSYKMIAADLGLSLDTVKSHIKNIYAKLQVNSNTEAVARALRENL
ncbi:DNA-binding response regulator [Flavobacterium magnum]|uniref:DNA-binding response regulator n=1 Tax=Flavobacterium magnum TaxID=2162713 RepID=A0A2S0RJA4_9FLAO|nr:response regulator transcription factor [Flavobacterium magnum]AWA30802.1 DNA-binding response regulator [Flavobacterium magnum]